MQTNQTILPSKESMDATLDSASLSLKNGSRRMMNSDEREVYAYLKGQPDQYVPANSICRHAGGKHKFRDSPDWAKPVLHRMQRRGILEVDASGAYRLTPVRKRESTAKRWVSPQIAAILKNSGRKFDGNLKAEDETEAYYDSL
jgi:hypothetical protein